MTDETTKSYFDSKTVPFGYKYPFVSTDIRDWVNTRVMFDTRWTTSLQNCYEDYLLYLRMQGGSLPKTKKGFFSQLRRALQKWVNINKVEISKQGRVMIRGIGLIRVHKEIMEHATSELEDV